MRMSFLTTRATSSSFFQYLLLEEYTVTNPVALIRQKGKFVQTRQGQTKVRRLSQEQWRTLIETAEDMASNHPSVHERTLFIIQHVSEGFRAICQ